MTSFDNNYGFNVWKHLDKDILLLNLLYRIGLVIALYLLNKFLLFNSKIYRLMLSTTCKLIQAYKDCKYMMVYIYKDMDVILLIIIIIK